jgi:hypothetical protein
LIFFVDSRTGVYCLSRFAKDFLISDLDLLYKASLHELMDLRSVASVPGRGSPQGHGPSSGGARDIACVLNSWVNPVAL